MTKNKDKEKSFAEYVQESPTAAEAEGAVTLTGIVLRSSQEGKFTLMMGGSKQLELNVDDVQDYQIIQESRGQRVVNVQIAASKLSSGQTVGTLSDMPTYPPSDPPFNPPTIKEIIKDLIQDPITGFCADQCKEPYLDPIGNPFEGNAARLSQPSVSAGMAPFVMATPHHAPQAAVMMQQMAANQARQAAMAQAQQTAGAGTVAAAAMPVPPGGGTIKGICKDSPDTLKEMTADTMKEVIKDALQDPVTLVEAIGGWGTPIVNPPVWNLPGLGF